MRNLKKELNTAIAWGMPDSECTGYTHTELVDLLSKSLKRIKYLESVLDDNKILYTHTDFVKPVSD